MIKFEAKQNAPVTMRVGSANPVRFAVKPPGSGGGNVFSEEISIIKVLDREEYDALPTPRPVNTVYLIRG